MPHQWVFVYMSVKYAILRWKNQTSVQSTDMSITLDKIVNHFSLFLFCISSIWRVRIWEYLGSLWCKCVCVCFRKCLVNVKCLCWTIKSKKITTTENDTHRLIYFIHLHHRFAVIEGNVKNIAITFNLKNN